MINAGDDFEKTSYTESQIIAVLTVDTGKKVEWHFVKQKTGIKLIKSNLSSYNQ